MKTDCRKIKLYSSSCHLNFYLDRSHDAVIFAILPMIQLVPFFPYQRWKDIVTSKNSQIFEKRRFLLTSYILDELMVEFSHRRNRNEYLFEDNPEFYLYFGMFFLCALLIITWSYFECTDSESVTKDGFQINAGI